MYISELNIQNFRKFTDYKVEFNGNLSVLIGKNGTGKTSVLEALTVALGSFFLGIDGASPIGIRPADARNQYYVFGEDVDVQKQFPVEISVKGTVNDRNIMWSRTLNTIKGRTTTYGAKEMMKISKECQERLRSGDTTLILPMLAYYGTGRLWDDHREKWSQQYRKTTRVNGYMDCLDGRASVKLLLAWFKRMSIKTANAGKDYKTFVAVKAAMESCFRRLTGVDEVKVMVNPDTFGIEIQYHSSDDKTIRIPLEHLSDGYKCALSLVGDIAFRMACLNPQLEERVLRETPGVVLIDEVDLHLHPEWQQHILNDLTESFPKVQFIVTTHAPAIINSTEDGNLLVLEENSIDYLGTDAYGQDVNTIVKAYMGSSVRPLPIQRRFDEFYRNLDENKIQEAKEVLEKLRQTIDVNDAEIVSCTVKLKLAERKLVK